MSTYSVGFDIFARDRASDVFEKVGNKAGTSSSKFDAFKGKAAAAGAIAGAAIVAFGKSSVEAFVDAEKSQRVLEDAYARFPAIANVSIESLRAQAAALQTKTKFDGDNINAMQGSLAQYKLTGTQISALTPLVLDYAEKTGKDLATASDDVGKALMGQGRSLKAIGIDFKDTGSTAGNFEQLMGGLRTQVGGFAEKEGASAEGKAEILKNKFGDLQETVGSKLLPVFEKLVGWLGVAVDFIDRNSTAIGTILVVGGSLIGFYKAWTAAQALLNIVMTANPIGLIVVAIGALVAGIIWVATQTTFFQDTWKKMTSAVGTAFIWLWNTILAPTIRFILNGFANMVGGIASFLRALGNIPGFGWAKDAANKMDAAAQKARDLAAGIKNIPTSKTVLIQLKGQISDTALRILNASKTGKARSIMDMRGFASGGTNIPAGLAWVGEKGRELIDVPEGSSIYDHNTSERMASTLGGRGNRSQVGSSSSTVEQPVTVQLVLDGRVVQESLLRLKRTNGGISLGLD